MNKDLIGSKPYKRYSMEDLLDLKRQQELQQQQKKPKLNRVEANRMFKTNEAKHDEASHPRRPNVGMATGRKLDGAVFDLPDPDRENDKGQ